jgi:hypothetical protein
MFELVKLPVVGNSQSGRQSSQFSTFRPFARVNGLDPINRKRRAYPRATMEAAQTYSL